jgi:hypothetical protein
MFVKFALLDKIAKAKQDDDVLGFFSDLIHF